MKMKMRFTDGKEEGRREVIEVQSRIVQRAGWMDKWFSLSEYLNKTRREGGRTEM